MALLDLQTLELEDQGPEGPDPNSGASKRCSGFSLLVC